MESVTIDAMPGGMHPALADLNRDMLFHYARRNGVALVPYSQGRSVALDNFDTVVPSGVRTHRLTLRRMAAPAPYVGTRQWYTWEVLVDELGRCIADDKVYRAVDAHRAFIEGWQGADDEATS